MSPRSETGVRRSRVRSTPALMGRRQIRGTARGFGPPSGLPKACLDGTPTQTGTRRSRVRSNPALMGRRQIRGTGREDSNLRVGCQRRASPPDAPSPGGRSHSLRSRSRSLWHAEARPATGAARRSSNPALMGRRQIQGTGLLDANVERQGLAYFRKPHHPRPSRGSLLQAQPAARPPSLGSRGTVSCRDTPRSADAAAGQRRRRGSPAPAWALGCA